MITAREELRKTTAEKTVHRYCKDKNDNKEKYYEHVSLTTTIVNPERKSEKHPPQKNQCKWTCDSNSKTQHQTLFSSSTTTVTHQVKTLEPFPIINNSKLNEKTGAEPPAPKPMGNHCKEPQALQIEHTGI